MTIKYTRCNEDITLTMSLSELKDLLIFFNREDSYSCSWPECPYHASGITDMVFSRHSYYCPLSDVLND